VIGVDEEWFWRQETGIVMNRTVSTCVHLVSAESRYLPNVAGVCPLFTDWTQNGYYYGIQSATQEIMKQIYKRL
jgi:hypothetical protein